MAERTAQPRAGRALARAACLLGLLALLAPAPARADTLGPQFPVSAGGFPTDAAAAFNPASSRYEVVWVGNGAIPNLGLLARRLDATGAPQGGPFALLEYPHVHTPVVAALPGGEFRVLRGEDVGSGIRILGDGLNSDADASADHPQYDEAPAFAADATGAGLAVWMRNGGVVLGQRLDAGGQEVGTANLPIAAGVAPQVARGDGEWLVAYRSGSSIERMRVGATGALIGGPVSAGSGAAGGPAVAYDPDRDEYLVVWQGLDPALGKQQIFGRRLSGTGAPLGSVIGISQDPAFDYGAAHPPFDGNQFDPDVAYDATAGQYLVAWTDTFEVRAQHLRGDGTPIGPRAFRVSFMGPAGDQAFHAYNPRVAANESAGEWLVTWDGDNADHQIWARRIAAPREAPVLSSISPASRIAGAAAFTLTVDGSGFIPSSRVEWNGVARPTTFVNATRLTAAIPASDLAGGAGNASVRVATPPPGGGASQARALAVTVSPPAAVPESTAAPVIAGTAQAGETLFCPQGAWNGAPDAFAWRWLRDGAEIAGAASQAHVVAAADVGRQVSCRVAATGTGRTSAAVSDPVVPVEADPLLPVPSPPGGEIGDSPAAGGGGAGGATASGPPGGAPATAKDTVAPKLAVGVVSRRRLRSVLALGLTVPVRCSEACSLRLRLFVDRRTARRLRLAGTTLGRATHRLASAGRATVSIELGAKARRRLRHARSLRVRLETRAVDGAGNAVVTTQRLTLVR